MSRSFRWIVAPLVVLALTAQLFAQEQNQNTQQQDRQQQDQQQSDQQQTQRQQGNQQGQGGAQMTDGQIATWLIIANDAELQLAQNAQQRVKHPQVREFIQTILQDHNQLADKLRKFAPDAPRLQGAGGDAAGQAGQRRQGDNQNQVAQQNQAQDPNRQNAPGAREEGQIRTGARLDQASRSGDGLPMMQVAQQLGQRAVQTMQQELDRYKPQDFDSAFLTFQVLQHLGMINEMEVLGQYASPELRQVIDQGRQSVEQHLTEARQLLVQVAQASRGQQQRTGADETDSNRGQDNQNRQNRNQGQNQNEPDQANPNREQQPNQPQ